MKGKEVWAHHVPPGPIPRDSMLFFGAQVGHSPAREAQLPGGSDSTVPHPVTGQPLQRPICRDCGGLLVDQHDDPLDPDSEVVQCCGSCQRSHWDGSRQIERLGHPIRDQDVDVTDQEGRTEQAVKSRKAKKSAKPPDERKPTRRQRRAKQYGH